MRTISILLLATCSIAISLQEEKEIPYKDLDTVVGKLLHDTSDCFKYYEHFDDEDHEKFYKDSIMRENLKKLITSLDKDNMLSGDEMKDFDKGADEIIKYFNSEADDFDIIAWVATYVLSPAGGKSGSSINKEDFTDMCKDLGVMDDDVDVDKAFKDFDLDGDGEISFDEQVAGISGCLERMY